LPAARISAKTLTMSKLADYRIFFREFRATFYTTGAVLPSGRGLARALAHYVAEPGPPRRILEVGPGTGAVTAELVRVLGPEDRLDLVELNDRFVDRLNERFAKEPSFQKVADRCRVLHQGVETLPVDQPYDLIVSGLPLNNFTIPLVEQILASLRQLLRPDGTLSFFEYIAIRHAKAIVSPKADRERLRGITKILNGILEPHEIRRDWVWLNVLPAWVHHVRLPG
jgi:phospholipid N-methyltransferase